MPVDLTIDITPRSPSVSHRPKPQPPSQPPTPRTRSVLKRRLTEVFRERVGDVNSSDTESSAGSSATSSPIRRSSSLSTLKRKLASPRRATTSNPRQSTQRNFPPESPPSYTILAPAPQDRLVVAHPSPSLSSSSGSSNALAPSRVQPYIPPRTSSVICEQLQISPSAPNLDEPSHSLIQSIYNEDPRWLERERLVQVDADFVYASRLQRFYEEAAEEERAGQRRQVRSVTQLESSRALASSAMQRSQSITTTQTQTSRTLLSTPTERTLSTATTQTQPSLPSSSSSSSPPRFSRQCFVCKGWKNWGAFPPFTPTDLCQHESSTCSRCLTQWVNRMLKIRGARGVSCSQCRILLNADEIHRARVVGSSGYLGS